ncbi:unnamed protein product [Adineta ricciae]|uniref:Transposase domain-containing protein n=1 Tax=Adineta ricciae TaxID=249248 RepID=A0A815VCH5_ADIRI|nr:unnamed protein product [Adineta ricciae]
MESKQSRWTTWRQYQKVDKAIALGLQLFQPDDDHNSDNDIGNIASVEEERASSDSFDTSDSEQEHDEQDDRMQDLIINHGENQNSGESEFFAFGIANETDIASALILLKKKHRLSTTCIKDIILLFKSLNVPNTPSSWHKVKHLLGKYKPKSTKYYICSVCNQSTTNEKYCQFCSTNHNVKLQSFIIFSIKDQLENILMNSCDIDLCYRRKDSLIRDVRDAAIFQAIRRRISSSMLTLTMNIDGIQPSKGSISTLWPIVFVINELSPSIRFAFENIILGGVWPGPAKPSRDQIKHLLRSVIDQLLLLEASHAYRIFNGEIRDIQVYLIAACCDKPAQALVQCVAQPTSSFGCGRCEIEGFILPTDRGGHVRSFSMTQHDIDNIQIRSNERYDHLINLFELQKQLRNLWPKRNRLIDELTDEQNEKGIAGICLFRELLHFDVGRSFMADSLHNIYIGLFKRMLGLWLGKEYRTREWNVIERINKLADLFKRVRLPSTTTRIPRSLLDYNKFKANELRVLLLFGHAIFKAILPKRFYDHLLQLVVIMHLAEGREIDKLDIRIITRLCHSFLIKFSLLYTERHCVQVVHSILHVPDTVQDFGPLTNYTTFHFENDIGMLVHATKGSRNHGQEMISNLCLYQHALRHAYVSSSKTNLAPFVQSHLSHLKNNDPKRKLIKVGHQNQREDSDVRHLFPQAKISFYNTLYIDHIRLTTRTYSDKKTCDDSNILFLFNGNKTFGRIRSILTVNDGEPLLFIAHSLNASPLICPLDGSENFEFAGVQTAPTTNWSFVLVNVEDFIEKVVIFERPDQSCCFFRFPNLVHSS